MGEKMSCCVERVPPGSSLSTVGAWYTSLCEPFCCVSKALSSASILSMGGSWTSSTTGFVAFGSSPALIAWSMRLAWYFANLLFDVISRSTSPHMLIRSINVAAAMKVSAVCFVTLFDLCDSIECFESKVLDVCFGGDVVHDGVVGSVGRFGSLELVHERDSLIASAYVSYV